MDGRGDSPRHPLALPAERPRSGSRLTEYALVAAIFCGSMAMWLVVPVGSLWIAALMSDEWTTVLLTVLFICPLAMAACALLLGRLYAVYLRSFAPDAEAGRSAWLGSLSGDRGRRAPRPVLDTCLTISAITAVLVLVVWFLFVAENFSPWGLAP